MLELSDVGIRFGGLHALRNISLSVKQGEIVGLIGPNGAGKTTLFNVVTGFLKADDGTITFEGRSITGSKPPTICEAGICRTFQIVKVFAQATVLDNVVTGVLVRGLSLREARSAARKTLEELGLGHRTMDIAGNLPIGQRKLLEMARALATHPCLLLLDEVMGGLTPTEINEIMRIIKRVRDQGITIFMIEHIMGAIMRLSDRIVVINMGEKIAEGPPEKIAHDPVVIKAYLGAKHGSYS